MNEKEKMATRLPRYPVSFGRSCRGRKESEEESNGKIRSACLVTQRATLRIVARSTLTRTSSEVQGGEDDEGGGWAANLMGMQCGNFSLDLVLLTASSFPPSSLPPSRTRGSHSARPNCYYKYYVR